MKKYPYKQPILEEAIIQYNINIYFIYLKNCNNYSNSGNLIKYHRIRFLLVILHSVTVLTYVLVT